jgi:AraC-like DNA-binding protein
MNSKLNRIQNWPELAEQANWSISALADKNGVTVRTLERYMLGQFGKCPRSWMVEQRQCRAIELFQNGSNVNETADSLAYQHARNFSRRFPHLKGKAAQTVQTQYPDRRLSQNESF